MPVLQIQISCLNCLRSTRFCTLWRKHVIVWVSHSILILEPQRYCTGSHFEQLTTWILHFCVSRQRWLIHVGKCKRLSVRRPRQNWEKKNHPHLSRNHMIQLSSHRLNNPHATKNRRNTSAGGLVVPDLMCCACACAGVVTLQSVSENRQSWIVESTLAINRRYIDSILLAQTDSNPYRKTPRSVTYRSSYLRGGRMDGASIASLVTATANVSALQPSCRQLQHVHGRAYGRAGPCFLVRSIQALYKEEGRGNRERWMHTIEKGFEYMPAASWTEEELAARRPATLIPPQSTPYLA
jgi:hypothetical protein